MNTIYNQLKESPLLYLSGGSKELFHSNFLYWLGMNYRQFPLLAGNELPPSFRTTDEPDAWY